MGDKGAATLGPPQHALLMALLAEEAIQALGQLPAEELLAEGVRHYGHQRGARMAQRAARLGLPLDWVSYQALGEWAAPHHPHTGRTLEAAPQWRRIVTGCPWNDAWAAEGAQHLGKLYCAHVDAALVEGFSCQMAYDVRQTLSAGDPCCEFVAAGYALTDEDLTRLEELRARLGQRAVMPWDYHLAHLYWSMRHTLEAHTGAAGSAIAERALQRLASRLGSSVSEAILRHADTDWNHAPDMP
ncbi:MAG: L-2-amino-thiazoline-4-carboxylic acid hydrolase [Anaerolineae bacterium]|jgi:hypothetical protein|nr:L-2-amino-thiazoline-4-carboxylic acid hydrolase [Chloroflexota bacterium]